MVALPFMSQDFLAVISMRDMASTEQISFSRCYITSASFDAILLSFYLSEHPEIGNRNRGRSKTLLAQ